MTLKYSSNWGISFILCFNGLLTIKSYLVNWIYLIVDILQISKGLAVTLTLFTDPLDNRSHTLLHEVLMIPMTILVAGPVGPCDEIFCYFLVFPV